MRAALCIDFGSTYTKVVVVDMETGSLVAASTAPTTVDEGISVGLEEAWAGVVPDLPAGLRSVGMTGIPVRLACSSAAGGLRMVACGLVPSLTVEAARRAALGAGARVVRSYGYELTEDEVGEIDDIAPDLVLLCGGTDGGNKTVLLHNASMLARGRVKAPVVVAGNKVVRQEAAAILRASGRPVYVSDNVMPSIDTLNVEPARQAIREAFMERIVKAKGLDRAERLVGGVVMPTPAAVLAAARLLAEGEGVAGSESGGDARQGGSDEGLGDLAVIDVGGATTDVHSMSWGRPTTVGAVVKGLPEPYAKRTVEGDLGVRVSAPSLLAAVGGRGLGELLGDASRRDIEVEAEILEFTRNTARLPLTRRERDLDVAMACAAVGIAMTRHVGTLEETYGPMGKVYVQRGKDLGSVGWLIGTGGPIVRAVDPARLLRHACDAAAATWDVLAGGSSAQGSREGVARLRPKSPVLAVDSLYVLSAAGLLSLVDPACALKLARASLSRVG